MQEMKFNIEFVPENDDNRNKLECFICPITFDVMENPVISKSGHSFEQNAIEDWIKKGGSNPLTREKMSLDELIPNRNLKEAISVWKSLDAEWKIKAEQLKQLKTKVEKQEQELSVSNVEFMKRRFKIQQQKHELKHKENIKDIPERFAKNELVEDAIAYINIDNYQAAIKRFKSLLSGFPNDDWIFHKLGWLYLKYGNELSDIAFYYEAINFLEKAIELNPNNDYAHGLCGWVWNRIRKLKEDDSLKEKEFTYYNKAININPNNSETHHDLGVYYFWEKDYDNAKKHLLLCIELSPNKCDAWIRLSRIYKMQENFSESERLLISAISFNPDREELLFALGDYYKNRAKESKNKDFYVDAIKYYKKSYSLNKSYSDAYAQCGYCLARLGQNDEAKQLYLKALEINPEDEETKKNLKWLEGLMNRNVPRNNERSIHPERRYNSQSQERKGYSPKLFTEKSGNPTADRKQYDSFQKNNRGRGRGGW